MTQEFRKIKINDIVTYTDSKGNKMTGEVSTFNTSYLDRRARIHVFDANGKGYKFAWILVRNLKHADAQ